jgi:hypothetical protein
MSTLFGPLSETISSVSCRDWAFAGNQMAGADKTPPAASADADFKKSRRLIQTSLTVERPREGQRKRRANSVSKQLLESTSRIIGAAGSRARWRQAA